jgi:hypothetical protein
MSMQQTIRKYPLTTAGLFAALVLAILAVTLELEVWEELVELIAKGEDFELDEFIIPVALIMLGFVGDAFLLHQARHSEQEKLHVYNHMNEEIMNEISMHLTKLLEFRTAMMKEGATSQDVRHELDRMIVRSFNHYEHAQRRSDVDSDVMPLVVPGLKTSRVSVSPSHPPGHSRPPHANSKPPNSTPPSSNPPNSKPPISKPPQP